MRSILFSSEATRDFTWSASKSSKVERVTNTELGKMGVDLSCVDGFSSKCSVHVLGRNALIVEVRLRTDLETMGLSCNSLEQCRASRTGSC